MEQTLKQTKMKPRHGLKPIKIDPEKLKQQIFDEFYQEMLSLKRSSYQEYIAHKLLINTTYG